MKRLIYLTGAPATGKSTLTENLQQLLPDTVVFTYSKELLGHVRVKSAAAETQDDLRRKSSEIITREDVEAVDKQLLALAEASRGRTSMVVDSHPVTIEKFGFRVTPFTKEQIKQLAPDVIICLYASAAVIEGRISTDPAGRPLPSRDEIDLHTQLQCQVASMYAFETGASLYFLDAAPSPKQVLENFVKLTKLKQ